MIWEIAVGGTLLTCIGAVAGWCLRHAKVRDDNQIWMRLCDNAYHRGLERGREETRKRILGAGRRGAKV